MWLCLLCSYSCRPFPQSLPRKTWTFLSQRQSSKKAFVFGENAQTTVVAEVTKPTLAKNPVHSFSVLWRCMHARSCGEFHDRYQMNAISTCVSYSCSIQISQTNMRPYPYSHTYMYSPDASGAVEAALRPNQATGNHRCHHTREW